MRGIYVGVFAVCVLLAGCSTGPEAVAERFLNALGDLKFQEAKKYCTPESKETIDLYQSIANSQQATVNANYTKVDSCQIAGNKGTCFYMHEGKIEQVNMVKTDDGWKVDMSFNTILELEKGEMLDSVEMPIMVSPDSTVQDSL
ncbi:MAG: hypothetical protein SFW35_11310 [Chitinophagales bacterium]|nr:hypothetical protein [Chitinophagales bacterium]